MQVWSLAMGIYSFWHPTAPLGFLDLVVKKRSISNISSAPKLQALLSLMILCYSFCVHQGEGESKGNFISRCPYKFLVVGLSESFLRAPLSVLTVVLSSVLFCCTCVGNLCPEKGQMVNILGKSSTLPLSHKSSHRHFVYK